jgi:hypothetical protein
MKNLIFIYLIFFSFSSFSADTPSICKRTQTVIKSYLSDPSSRIAFRNGGGLIGGGVCWWHSRLQRSSAYLVSFLPDASKPSKPEVWNILSTLRKMNAPAIIPGYRDFETFSRDWEREVQGMLDDWQKLDGFFNFQWIRGISGSSRLDPEAMELRMKSVYETYLSSPTPVWIMAQIRGIEAHSYLILNMTARENGYDMEVIDSNYPSDLLKIEYYIGDVELTAPNVGFTFVPYVGFQNDLRQIFSTLERECGRPSHTLVLPAIPLGDVEIP